jgi:hypothetical protein
MSALQNYLAFFKAGIALELQSDLLLVEPSFSLPNPCALAKYFASAINRHSILISLQESRVMGAPKRPRPSDSSIDRKSFMLGMITAFAQCVAGEAKKMAFSPPFYTEDYKDLREEAERICQEQGVFLWHEKNADLPAAKRLHWLVLFKFPEILREYKKLRRQGFNPALHFESFMALLSYGSVWGKEADKVVPRMREKRPVLDTVARILLKPGDWPITNGARPVTGTAGKHKTQIISP